MTGAHSNPPVMIPSHSLLACGVAHHGVKPVAAFQPASLALDARLRGLAHTEDGAHACGVYKFAGAAGTLPVNRFAARFICNRPEAADRLGIDPVS